MQFSRVQAPNVAAFNASGGLGNVNRPVGGGSWDFGIARTELTLGQFVDFINAFGDTPLPSDRPWSTQVWSLLDGSGWGGGSVYTSGLSSQGRPIHAVVEGGENRPVRGMEWFGAAAYCNYLQNGRQASFEAMTNGAYDLRNWDLNVSTTWSEVERSPDAQYFIPTYDEWALGTYFDPNRNGPGSAGWWPYSNGMTRAPIGGAPGEGETSAEWTGTGEPGSYELVAVAAYPNHQSAWGLFDTSGSASEWVEDPYVFTNDRLFVGSRAGPWLGNEILEPIGWAGADSGVAPVGVRLGTRTVPSPCSVALVAGWTVAGYRRRRR
jgi:formylglycine-generating enzyme required for sulfatase activity